MSIELSNFLYSPTDALVSSLKKTTLKFTLRFTLKQLRHVSVLQLHPESVYCRTVQRTYTNKDPIYAATTPPY